MPNNKCMTCYWAYRACWGNHQKLGCKAKGRKYVPNEWMDKKDWLNQERIMQ